MATKLQLLIKDYQEALELWIKGKSWSPALSNLFKQLLRETQPLVDAMDSCFLPVWQKWVFPQIAHSPGDWKQSYPGVDVIFFQKGDICEISFSNEGDAPFVSFEVENDAGKGTTIFHFFEMEGTIGQALFLINTFCNFAEKEEKHI